MPNQERICIAITKSDIMGGAQKYVLTLAKQYAARGKDVTVLAGGNGILFTYLEEAGIPFVRLEHGQRDISLSRELGLLREMRRALRQLRPDVLHLNSSKMGAVGSLVGRIAGVPRIIFTAHGWAFNEDRPGYQKAFFYLAYWLTALTCDMTICVSEKTRSQVIFLPGMRDRTVVIHNGIEVPDFLSEEDAREKLLGKFPFLEKDKGWIVVLAELHPIKGHDILLEAVSSLRTELEGWQVLCLGTGQSERGLKELVTQKNLAAYVYFGGFLQNASSYLKAFGLSVLPSRSEALPLSVLEAGLAEVPVVASAVGGIPEIITDTETGFLAVPENAQALSSKIKAALSLKPEARGSMTAALRKKIEDDFSVAGMIDRTLAVYDQGK